MDAHPYNTAPEPTPQLPLRHHFPSTSPVMSQIIRGQNQLDEGFSEETRSQSDSDMIFTPLDLSDVDANAQKVLQQLMALPSEQREYIISEGVNTLNSLAKGRVQRQLINLTHFDPAQYLPNEVFLQIFSYLSPRDLLSASTISRDWRIRSQDERLWRMCFAREGWVLDKSKIEAFEKFAHDKGLKAAENATRRSVPPLERRASKKRKTEEAFSGDEGAAGSARLEAGEAATSIPRADGAGDLQDEMEGVEGNGDTTRSLIPASRQPSPAIIAASLPPTPADFKLQPELFQSGRGQDKLSWPYLYKQRRRLEANWEKGFYKMFQLPHRDYPDEGHEECVYTIQHTAQHLVSGSRDKSIRIWDLDTCRLKGQPLRGHDASVLCLQFDERPEHDIIVSGGSDAYVIIWKFSTGEIIQKMTDAHTESVLNLRFDDRYIVTCSKDKSIKVWNRHPLDRNSPLIPTHALYNFTDPALADLNSPIKEYTLLTSFLGHGAAVNAVMIHDTTIVSASGDRTIKAWDLHSGAHKKSYSGHGKGIACVQFDGRRIVSGSSDNTVRIFDAEQQAEIACLSGHNNLVRTVQARFGDLETTTDAELQAEAQAADRRFYKALSQGMTPASASRRGPRNPGSSRPEDMQSVGTKIPPGGGGSRWAKIVSGSYDETVIVWKRDSEGKWQVKLRLHQDQLLRTNRSHRRREQLAAAGNAGPNNPNPPPQANAGNAAQQNFNNAQAHLQQMYHAAHQQHQHQLPMATQTFLNNQAQHNPPQPNAQQTTVTTTTAGPTTTFTAHNPQTHQTPTGAGGLQLHHQLAPLPGGAVPVQYFPANGGPPQLLHPNHPLVQHQHTQHQQAQQQQQAAQAHAQGAAGPNPNQPAAAVAGAGAGGAGTGGMRMNESNRVFKLQFDARRIVCCSQNRTIVGWDFANGDEELERVGEWSLETA